MPIKILNTFIRFKNQFFRNMSEAAQAQVAPKKVKYDGRVKKRKWEERISPQESNKELCVGFERIKRKKYAMLLSYSGVNYFGMQRNPGMKTIEEELLSAMKKADVITEEAFNQIQTINFQRAARTDKGVSAVRQVLSLKLPDNVTPDMINQHLPETIRIFSIKRATKGFNSKSQCDARTYSYMLPTVAFCSRETKLSDEIAMSYRITEDTFKSLNDALKLFVGTKNFHNFTSKKRFMDPSSNRYMMSFDCEQPFVEDGMEFAILKVKGQSFMLHQIRKMVGLTIAIVRGHTNKAFLERSFTSDKVDIPTAPGLGLVLEQTHYTRYNDRYGSDGMHEKLDWVDVQEEVENFKKKYINPTIIKTELEEKSMLTWLEKLYCHKYDVRTEDQPMEDDYDESDDEKEE